MILNKGEYKVGWSLRSRQFNFCQPILFCFGQDKDINKKIKRVTFSDKNERYIIYDSPMGCSSRIENVSYKFECEKCFNNLYVIDYYGRCRTCDLFICFSCYDECIENHRRERWMY